MPISLKALSSQLRKGLAPVYLLGGDEPLQLEEGAEQVRAAARRAGFEEREWLDAEDPSVWAELTAARQSLGLFSRKKRIELRLWSEKIGREGSDALQAYCKQPPEEALLLIVAQLTPKACKASWVQAIERTGVFVRVYSLQGRQLLEWIQERLQSRGLVPGPGVVERLAAQVEGNLVAAAQEIDLLALLHGPGILEESALLESLEDQARFSPFSLAEAALAGDRLRTQRILRRLASEAVPAPLVLWHLTQAIRLLSQGAWVARQGGDPALASFFQRERIWESRRRLLTAALGRFPPAGWQDLLLFCALVDRQIKGLAPGDPWLSLARIADRLASGEG